MKKSLITFSALLVVGTLTAYGYYNWNNTSLNQKDAIKQLSSNSKVKLTPQKDFLAIVSPEKKSEFTYRVSPRYVNVISKERIQQAKTILDILPAEETVDKEAYDWSVVSILKDGLQQPTEYGENEQLTSGQLELLQSVDYSTDIFLSAYCKRVDAESGEKETYQIRYYITVVPEQEAKFVKGHEELMKSLKKDSQKQIANLDEDKLRPGQISFIVAGDASVKDVELRSTSGYPSVDEKLMEIIKNTSKQWKAASNAKGEAVDQEFVFYFGKRGC